MVFSLKVLLLGYYGYGNYGDELMRLGITDFLKKFNIQYVTALPKRISKDTISRFNIFEILEYIYDSDAVIYGGGGLLQDITSTRSFLYYASVINLSLIMRTPVILFGNSIGPVKKKGNRILLRNILKNKNTFLFARDVVSYKYGLCLNKETELSCDPSIRYLRKFLSVEEFKSKNFDKTYDLLLVPKNNKKDIEEYSVLNNYFKNIIIAPAQRTDMEISKKLAKKLECELFEDIEDVDKFTSLILSSKFVISERFHPVVVASYYGIPFISLENSKSQRFFRKYTNRKEFFAKNLIDIEKRLMPILNEPLKLNEIMDKESDESYKKLYKTLLRATSNIIYK